MPKRTKPIIPPAPTAPGGAKPMPHADSPTLAADSGEYHTEAFSKERLAGETRREVRCPTCGTMTLSLTRCPVDGRLVE